MYLLDAETQIDWELGVTNNVIAVADLDLLIIDPEGTAIYLDSPIDPGDFLAPTPTVVGYAHYDITPNIEGLWKIRLVIGTAASYSVLSKVEMMVFDNRLTVNPFSEQIGTPLPYDMSFFAQGFTVPGEVVGFYLASRDLAMGVNDPRHVAEVVTVAGFQAQTYFIKYNGATVGTIIFQIGAQAAAILCEALVLTVGDQLTIVTAGSTDANIADLSVTLVGCANIVSCDLL